jgi:hypothetical protein
MRVGRLIPTSAAIGVHSYREARRMCNSQGFASFILAAGEVRREVGIGKIPRLFILQEES